MTSLNMCDKISHTPPKKKETWGGIQGNEQRPLLDLLQHHWPETTHTVINIMRVILALSPPAGGLKYCWPVPFSHCKHTGVHQQLPPVYSFHSTLTQHCVCVYLFKSCLSELISFAFSSSFTSANRNTEITDYNYYYLLLRHSPHLIGWCCFDDITIIPPFFSSPSFLSSSTRARFTPFLWLATFLRPPSPSSSESENSSSHAILLSDARTARTHKNM